MLFRSAVISQQHHERYDGNGYPDGRKGEEIHIFARIVAVADVFDALTHKRCYKEAWPIDKVVNLLREESGKHLDPTVVSAMLNIIDKAVEINQTYQD